MSLLPTLPSRKILQYTKTLEQLNSGISILDGTGVQFFAGLGESTQTFTTPGTYTWTAPDGITSIEAACWGAGGGGGGGVSSYAGTYQVPFIGPQTFGPQILATAHQTYATSGSYVWTCPSGVTSVTAECWGAGGGGGGGCSSFGGNVQLPFNSNQTFGTPSVPMNPSTWYPLTGPQFQTNQTGQGTIPIVPGTTELSFSIALYGQVVAGFSTSSGSTTFLPVSGSRSDDGPFHVDMGPSGSRVWAADIANTFTIVSTAITTVTVPVGAEYLVFADGLPFISPVYAPITVNAIVEPQAGGGGGGGGYVNNAVAVIPGMQYSVFVGGGGTPGGGSYDDTSYGADGGGGGSSYFQSIDTLGQENAASGGKGGASGGIGGGADVGSTGGGAGGAGGYSVNGTDTILTFMGDSGTNTESGASSLGGNGGSGATNDGLGANAGMGDTGDGATNGGSSNGLESATAGGGGGGGFASVSQGHQGASGGDGQVILTWISPANAVTQAAVWIPLNGIGIEQANFLYNSIGSALDYNVVPGTTELVISASGVLNGANADTYTWPLVAGFSTVSGSTTFLPVSGTTHVNLGPSGNNFWASDISNTFGVNSTGVTVVVPNSANYLVFAYAAAFGSTPNNTLFGDITLPSGEIVPAAGGGGGGGAYIINTIPVVAGTQYTVIVGAGGIAGIGAGGSTSYAQDGAAGGVSSFGSTVAGGGGGGTSGGIGGGSQNNSSGGGTAGTGGPPSGPSTLQFTGGNGAAGPTATPALNGAGGGGGALTTATGANANGAIAGGDGGSYSPSVTAGSSDGTETSPAGGGGYGGYASDVFGATGSNGGHGQVILTWIPASLLGSYYDSDIARGFNVHLQAVSPGIFVLPAGDGPAPNYIFYEGFLLISAMLASTPAQAAAIAAQVLSQLANSGQDFTSDSTTQTNLLFGMPAGYTVIGVKVSLTTPFQIGTGSGVSLQIGTAAVPTFYAPSYELTSAPFVDISHANYNDSNPNHNTLATTFGAHDIYAVFTSTNVSISTISAGAVEIVIQYRLS